MKQARIYTLSVLCILCALCSTSPLFGQKSERHNFTVVIDPGHGGRDPGAVGKRGKEKDINLKVSLKVGNLIRAHCPDVNVQYTRSTDVFIPLDRRAEIANKAKADLFISIHTNSVAKGKQVRGTETYTLGLHRTAENLEVAKKENAVILIEENYQQRYAGFSPNSAESYIIFEFVQDKNMEKSVSMATHIQKHFRTSAQRVDKGVHQAGFLVLRETSMPSVLVELGYISNLEEEQYLLSERGSAALAESIYKAFLAFKQEHESSALALVKQNSASVKSPSNSNTSQTTTASRSTAAKKTTTSTSSQAPKSQAKGKPTFKVQILTADRVLPKGSKQFKGLTPVGHYKEKGIYKYTYGENTDYNQILRLQKSIQPKFKDAFIIAFKNGEKININEAIKEFRQNKK
ncbi:MAG: N-acetylmuramoyl-L-alanine amidase family protein [Phocaeicola sp.]